MLRYYRPSFFNNFETEAKKNASSKNIRLTHSTFNTLNYIKQKSSNIAGLLNLETEGRKKSINSLNNFSNFINQTNAKNDNLIKINYESSSSAAAHIINNKNDNNNKNKNENLYDIAFAQYQLNNKADFAADDVPKRFKFQMDLLRSKSNKRKTNKTSANAHAPKHPIQLETEEYDENDKELLNEYFNNNNVILKKNIFNNDYNNNFYSSKNNLSSQNNIFSNAQISEEINYTNQNQFNALNYFNLNSNQIDFSDSEAKRILISKDKISLINNQTLLQNSKIKINNKNNKNNNKIRLNSQNDNNAISRYSNSGAKKDVNKNEKIVISGLHAAKIRMLKGLDVKGEKKKSDAFLNVKCVGLKADFLVNGNNFNNNVNIANGTGNKINTNELAKDDKSGAKNISSVGVYKTNNGFRISKTGNFPVINNNKNDNK